MHIEKIYKCPAVIGVIGVIACLPRMYMPMFQCVTFKIPPIDDDDTDYRWVYLFFSQPSLRPIDDDDTDYSMGIFISITWPSPAETAG